LKKGFSCFDKALLSMPAASFDRLRTNGWRVEGLSTNGNYSMIPTLGPFALRFSKGERGFFNSLPNA
jgi:hypothetical protein